MAKRAGVDKWLFFITVLLVVVGLAMVFSASSVVAKENGHSPFSIVGKQALWALCGVGALLLLSHIDFNIYKSPRFLYPAICVTTVLLLAVFAFPKLNNAHRWIRFGVLHLQPSELAKPVMILFLAWFLSTRLDKMGDWRQTLLRAPFIPLVFIILIVPQPDLGTALVLAGVTVLMLFLAGMNWKYLAGAIVATLPILASLLIFVPFRMRRILVFLHPNCGAKDLTAANYHVCQSLIAVGAGGIGGRGYMEGAQKLFFLPEAHNDFIFANIAEELGLIGAIAILLLFAFFALRGLRVAFHVEDPFARLAAFGITTAIVLQAFFNISVVIALLPTKGIPLPLISDGGTSVFVTLASIGVLLNISRKVD